MVEGQGAAQQRELQGQGYGADAVELEYRPTVGDYTSALRARRGVSKAARRQFWVLGGATVVVALEGALALSGGDASVFPVIWLLVFAPLMLLSPWLQARQVSRVSERQGVFRVRVTDAGVSVATDNTTASVNWAAQPRYREKPDIFVLFSADKNATCFTVLPKRAVRTPADVERLRAILDRNLTRA
ncbi:YcxB family protein [Streptomyces sp. NPDC088253]|uniref:YcxB family protein n=1 Tax=Streptomyces sp. NPDC088253 TaxID=3365846 RepID=UPI003824E0DE